jgi:hypothetical protein
MISAIAVPLIVVAALAYALRSRRTGDLIETRPYNNRYNDASAARDDHFG